MPLKGKLTVIFTLLAFAVTGASLVSAPTAQASPVVIVENSPEAALANLIFRILDIPVTVYEITELKTGRSMGHGEIALAHSLAHASGYPLSYILHLRFDHGMGWGKIAKTLGVKLHGPADKSVRILREAKLDRDADDFTLFIRVDLDADDDDDRDEKPKANGHGKGRGKNK